MSGSTPLTDEVLSARLSETRRIVGKATRNSAAKLRRDAGESIEDVSRFLDHSSLGVTTVYLRRLEGQEDKSWAKVAVAIGV